MADFNQEPIQFEMIGKRGKKILCQVLFTFESEERNAHYIVYSEVKHPERISASKYLPSSLNGTTLSTLIPIESDEEWDFVAGVIDQALGGNG